MPYVRSFMLKNACWGHIYKFNDITLTTTRPTLRIPCAKAYSRPPTRTNQKDKTHNILNCIVEGCCMEYLTVMLGRVSPLGVEVDAVVVRIPSHVIPVRKGCHRQWRRHRHARSLVSDTEYLLHRLLALRLDKLPRLVRHRRSDARK